jgi:hypothetical protein
MKRQFLLALSGVLVCGSIAVAQQRGTFTPIFELPQPAMKSVETATNDVNWLLSFRFVDSVDGSELVWYRVAGRESKANRLVKVMVYANGRIIDVRTEMTLKDVPGVVTAAVSRGFPAFEAKSAEVVGKSMKAPLYYRFEGTLDGTPCAIVARLDGTKVIKEGS